MRSSFLPLGQRLAPRDAQLPLDEVLAGDHLGDRMLDLEPGVHLHEIERAGACSSGLGDELDGARAHVADRFRRRHRGAAHRGAALWCHAGCGRFLEHLLVAPLDRAVALEEVHAVAVAVAEDLDLDVARPAEILLDQDAVVAEGGGRLALAGGERRGELARRLDDAHALAAAARGGLDEHRVADAIGFALQERRILLVAVIARHERDARLLHDALRRALRAHRADRGRRRADEHDARALARLGEVLVLREEAVAGMDRLRAGGARDLEDAIAAQVAFLCRGRADEEGLVGGEDVLRARIGFRVHGDGLDREPAGGADDPAGDLAAVGDEDLREHQNGPGVTAALTSFSSRSWRRSALPLPTPASASRGTSGCLPSPRRTRARRRSAWRCP